MPHFKSEDIRDSVDTRNTAYVIAANVGFQLWQVTDSSFGGRTDIGRGILRGKIIERENEERISRKGNVKKRGGH